jgi:hypothetical protein
MRYKSAVYSLKREEGQVWTYVLWIVMIALVIGVIITQFGPIIGNHITIGSAADDAAEEGAIAYDQHRGDMDKVYDVVQKKLEEKGARLDGTIEVVKGQGGEPDMMTVPVRKISNSYLFENVGYLCKYTEAKAFGEYPIP